MKIKDGLIMRTVMGKSVVVATGEAAKTFSGMISLNGTATVIWKGVEDGLSDVEIAAKLTEEYDVTAEKALADVQKLLNDMRQRGFFEE